MYPTPRTGNSLGASLLVLAILVIAIFYVAPNTLSHISLSSIPAFNSNSATINDSMSVTTMINTEFGSYAPAAMQIAKCESGLNPNAVNTQAVGNSQATGIFQILYPSTWNTTSFANQSPTDPATNVQAAHQIFTRDGNSWHEWACARIVGLQ